MTCKINIKIESNASDMLGRVNALASHVAGAQVGDQIAEMAREIGEIDLDRSISMNTEFQDGVYRVDVQPVGDLANLLQAFECVQK